MLVSISIATRSLPTPPPTRIAAEVHEADNDNLLGRQIYLYTIP